MVGTAGQGNPEDAVTSGHAYDMPGAVVHDDLPRDLASSLYRRRWKDQGEGQWR